MARVIGRRRPWAVLILAAAASALLPAGGAAGVMARSPLAQAGDPAPAQFIHITTSIELAPVTLQELLGAGAGPAVRVSSLAFVPVLETRITRRLAGIWRARVPREAVSRGLQVAVEVHSPAGLPGCLGSSHDTECPVPVRVEAADIRVLGGLGDGDAVEGDVVLTLDVGAVRQSGLLTGVLEIRLELPP